METFHGSVGFTEKNDWDIEDKKIQGEKHSYKEAN